MMHLHSFPSPVPFRCLPLLHPDRHLPPHSLSPSLRLSCLDQQTTPVKIVIVSLVRSQASPALSGATGPRARAYIHDMRDQFLRLASEALLFVGDSKTQRMIRPRRPLMEWMDMVAEFIPVLRKTEERHTAKAPRLVVLDTSGCGWLQKPGEKKISDLSEFDFLDLLFCHFQEEGVRGNEMGGLGMFEDHNRTNMFKGSWVRKGLKKWVSWAGGWGWGNADVKTMNERRTERQKRKTKTKNKTKEKEKEMKQSD